MDEKHLCLNPIKYLFCSVLCYLVKWLGKNTVLSTGKKNSRKVWIGALATAKQLKKYKMFDWLEKMVLPLRSCITFK